MADNLADGRLSVAEVAVRELTSVGAPTKSRQTYLAVRRVFDTATSVLLLLVLLPVLGLIVALIRLDSRGPALFRQDRIGKDGAVFTILKFRTMVTSAPSYSYKVPLTDRRITRIGKLLRRSGLDELPQLWNVVRGDMSLIGPRPEMPFIVDEYIERNHARHSVRPGITGWWQVNHRNGVPLHLNLEYDLYYLENLSPSLDWRIVRKTVAIVVAGLFKRH